MIKSIKIKNFQSHVDNTLELSDGVNIIVGSSDSGKTAVLRALRWAITNRPTGDHFRSWWGGDTAVTVTTDKEAITRGKDKEECYVIEREGDPVIFKAFGTTVPKEVTEAFNIDDINLQGQLDSPFLLTESPGQVAAHFNRIAHLDKIDSSTSAINGWIREITATTRFKKEEQERLTDQLKSFDYLDKLEAEIDVLEQLDKDKNLLSAAKQRLASVISQTERTEQKIQSIESGVITLEKDVDRVLLLIDRQKELSTGYRKLKDLINSITAVEGKIEALEALLPINDVLYQVIADNALRETKEGSLLRLTTIIRQIEESERNIKQFEDKVADKEGIFHKNMVGVCPLCGNVITKE